MNNRQNLAEHGAGLCVWALAGLGVTANLTGAASLAVVGFITFNAFKKYRKDRCVSAAERAAKALTPQHGMPERGIEAALRLIKELPKPVAIAPSLIKDAHERNDFPNTLYNHLFANTYVPTQDGVDKALRIVIAEAYEVLRLDDDIHELFTQEALKELEHLAALSAENDAAFLAAIEDLTRGQVVIAAAVQSTEQAVSEVADRLLDETADMRAKLHSAEKFATALAYKYAQDFPDDLDAALKTLASALERAAEASARNALPSNLSKAVDAIVAEVERLKNEGHVAEAYAKAQEERVRRKDAREQQFAEDSRVLDLVIEHASYMGDAEGYANAVLEQIELDSSGAEDTFERLRALRRERFEDGFRLGTPFALTAAASLARICIRIAPTPYLRAMAQDALATALATQGARGQGADGNPLLAQAVESYRAALGVLTEADHPLDWAMTMQNLAIALEHQGARTQGAAGSALLTQADESFRAALRVFTEAEHPVDWAMTMQNLAGLHHTQGIRTQGSESKRLLATAVESYRAALRVRTEADHPMEWAMTAQNLGNALSDQGARTQGAQGDALLTDAIENYRAALRVFTEADHPVFWEGTMQNLAGVFETQGIRNQGTGRTDLLADAVKIYRAVLRAIAEAERPIGWANAKQNLGNTLRLQGTLTKGAEGNALLAEAVESFHAALRVRTEADHPVQWAMTQENLAIAELTLAAHDTTKNPRPHLEAALAHVDNALRVYDPVHMSYDHGTATALRDDILKALSSPPAT